jgi:WD40 repeat protein
VVFSPDGSHIASGSKDKSVIIWDAQTGKRMSVLSGHESGVFGLAFGMRDMLVSSEAHGRFKFWNYKTSVGLPGPEIPLGHTAFGGLSASRDLKRVLVGHTAMPLGDRSPAIQFLGLEKMEWSPPIWRESEDLVLDVALSPNGQTLAACIGQETELLDAKTGRELARFRGEGTNRRVAYAPDSSRIAVGTENNQILIFSIPGTAARNLGGGKGWVTTVSFGAHGRLMAAGPDRIWDVLTGNAVINSSNYRLAPYQRIALCPVSERIAGSSPDAIVDLRSGQNVVLLQSSDPPWRPPLQHAFSRDGELVAKASSEDWVGVWDARTGFHLGDFMTERIASCVGFSPDNKWIAAGSGDYDRQGNAKHVRRSALMVWDVRTRHPLLSLENLPLNVWSVAFSPDGSRLAAAMGKHNDGENLPGIVRIWETTNWTIVGDLRGHSNCVWSVSFNHDGTRIASASGLRASKTHNETWTPGEVILWEVSTCQEVWRFRDEGGAVFGVEFSPDGRRLAMGGQRGIVTLLDCTRLAETPRYQPLPEDP